MIGVGIALVILGVATLFFMPWVGIPAGIIGLVLVALFFLGFGSRRTGATTSETDRRA
jgi:hypothetical protein